MMISAGWYYGTCSRVDDRAGARADDQVEALAEIEARDIALASEELHEPGDIGG